MSHYVPSRLLCVIVSPSPVTNYQDGVTTISEEFVRLLKEAPGQQITLKYVKSDANY